MCCSGCVLAWMWIVSRPSFDMLCFYLRTTRALPFVYFNLSCISSIAWSPPSDSVISTLFHPRFRKLISTSLLPSRYFLLCNLNHLFCDYQIILTFLYLKIMILFCYIYWQYKLLLLDWDSTLFLELRKNNHSFLQFAFFLEMKNLFLTRKT